MPWHFILVLCGTSQQEEGVYEDLWCSEDGEKHIFFKHYYLKDKLPPFLVKQDWADLRWSTENTIDSKLWNLSYHVRGALEE